MKLKVMNKLNPFKIVNKADVAELWIYGDIVDDAEGGWRAYWGEEGFVCPANVREELEAIGDKPVNIFIASDGGSVNAGLAIVNIIQRLKGKKTAYVDSWAASIASVIALACDEVIVPTNCFIMIHNPAGGCIGTAKDMRDYADLLDVVRDSIIKVYMTNSDKTAEDFIKLMDAESWLTAEQASELWKHVTVVEATNIAVAVVSNYENAPEVVKQAVNNTEITTETTENEAVNENEVVNESENEVVNESENEVVNEAENTETAETTETTETTETETTETETTENEVANEVEKKDYSELIAKAEAVLQ